MAQVTLVDGLGILRASPGGQRPGTAGRWGRTLRPDWLPSDWTDGWTGGRTTATPSQQVYGNHLAFGSRGRGESEQRRRPGWWSPSHPRDRSWRKTPEHPTGQPRPQQSAGCSVATRQENNSHISILGSIVYKMHEINTYKAKLYRVPLCYHMVQVGLSWGNNVVVS